MRVYRSHIERITKRRRQCVIELRGGEAAVQRYYTTKHLSPMTHRMSRDYQSSRREIDSKDDVTWQVALCK